MSVGQSARCADECDVPQSGETGVVPIKSEVMVGSSATEKVRVVVGDDHPLFRDGVVRALTSSGAVDVVAEAADGASALALIKTHRPHVALLDYRMPHLDRAQLRPRYGATAFRPACCCCRRTMMRRSISGPAGRRGRVHAEGVDLIGDRQRRAGLRQGARCAISWHCRRPREEIRRRAEPPPTVLSPRERQVLDLIACGRNIPAIAAGCTWRHPPSNPRATTV